MADDKAIASTKKKQRQPFNQLASSLSQLVDDRFDEDQHDQAVDLLEQLKAEDVQPSTGSIQKLVALSLCSLAPGQVASTSRWTLHHQLRDIAARLLAQPKTNKNDRNALKAASAASDRPSPSAVLKASSLLVQYSEASATTAVTDGHAEASEERQRKSSLLARHILESLPSRRKPLELPQADSPDSPQRARRGSQSDSDHDGSFEISSIERWVRDDLHRAEDVWDLLCGRRFSNPTEVEEVSLQRVSEFWMSDSERRRYQKQLQASSSSYQRLEDKLREIRWKKLNGGPNTDSSDSDSDNASDEDLLIGLSIPGCSTKRPAKSKGRSKADSSPNKPSKRARTARSAGTKQDEEEAGATPVKLTEGAWRTLSVLLQLWERASPRIATADLKADSEAAEEPPLLWQFPSIHQAKQTGRSASRSTTSQADTDDISRALDVAFSFPGILPAFAPSSASTETATDLFETAKSTDTRGHARPFSSVPEAELVHRREVANQNKERIMAARAETAACLLDAIFNLVQRKYISSVAFMEGCSERMEALRAQEVQYLMLSLLSRKPYVVASVLTAYLQDATRTRPDKKSSAKPVQFRFGDEQAISMDAALAYAMPHEEAIMTRLKHCASREQDGDARTILEFLSLNKLELDSSAASMSPLTFPTRSESRKRPMVQKQRLKQVKSEASSRKIAVDRAEAAHVLTDEMKTGGLAAFAFVRATQMEARDRVNQMKFLVARALVSRNAGSLGPQSSSATPTKLDPAPNREESDQTARLLEQQNLRFFLTRLVKAYQHDANDFRECVTALKTHVSKEASGRRASPFSVQAASKANKDGSAALPTLDALADRCQKCLDATEGLLHATHFLLKATPRS